MAPIARSIHLSEQLQRHGVGLLVIIVGVVIRAFYAFYFEPFLHWDEAPQALMALKIAQGEMFPWVHFQLPYIGAVEQYGLSLFFLLFNDDIFALNLFYFIISSLSLFFASSFYRSVLSAPWNVIALALFALTPPLVLLFSLQSYSFGSLVLFETLILGILFSQRLVAGGILKWALIGGVSGIALYNNVLFIWVLLFSLWRVCTEQKRQLISIFCFFFIFGYAPMLLFNWHNEFISYQFLVAKFLNVSGAMVGEHGVVKAVLVGVAEKLSGNGPDSDRIMFYHLPRLLTSPAGHLIATAIFAGIAVLTSVAFMSLYPRFGMCVGSFGGYSLGHRFAFYTCTALICLSTVSQVRYMAALAPVLPVDVSDGLLIAYAKNKVLGLGSLAFILTFLLSIHVLVFVDDASFHVDEIGKVYSILESRGLTHGYGSYQFQSYAAFISKESIKISPQIGPLFIDKIPSYSQIVDQEDEVFFIFPAASPYLDKIDAMPVFYQIEKTDEWSVIWGLSKRLYPEDLLTEVDLVKPGGFRRWSYKTNPAVLEVFRGGY